MLGTLCFVCCRTGWRERHAMPKIRRRRGLPNRHYCRPGRPNRRTEGRQLWGRGGKEFPRVIHLQQMWCIIKYTFIVFISTATGKQLSSHHVYVGINWRTHWKDAYLPYSCFSSSQLHCFCVCQAPSMNIQYLCVCVISTIVRIQFRLPDGSSFTNQFPLQGRLQEVRQFVVQVWFHDYSLLRSQVLYCKIL